MVRTRVTREAKERDFRAYVTKEYTVISATAYEAMKELRKEFLRDIEAGRITEKDVRVLEVVEREIAEPDNTSPYSDQPCERGAAS